MKVYKGTRLGGQKTVTVDGRPLVGLFPSDPRRNVPFDWGSQPASRGAIHLAEALLANCTGRKYANPLARAFADERLSKLPFTEWTIESEEIEKWLRLRGAIAGSTQRSGWPPAVPEEVGSSAGELKLNDFPRSPDWLNSLRDRINPDSLANHGFPRPKDVRLSRSPDSTGEDALYVYLVFPDRTPEGAFAWDKIEPMVSWVRNLIWTETGARLWPYVKVKRERELAGGLA